MKKMVIVLLMAVFLSGCAYNSRNLVYIFGNGMDVSYGLISAKNINGLIVLRDTNMGAGEAANNLRDFQEYFISGTDKEL